MRIGNRLYQVDWGHFVVATFIAGVSLGYLLDARATSLNIQNLLLVQPTALFVLALYVLVLPQCVRVRPAEVQPAAPQADLEAAGSRHEQWRGLARIATLVAAFGLFVFTVEEVGYDVGGWAFTLAGLWICGERRWWVLAVFPVLFALGVIYGFKLLVPYPMVTRII